MTKKHEKIYLLTDGCMWELNKQTGNEHPHAMEVVDLETGAVRYIKSGSRIAFIEGEISDIRDQAAYNKKTALPNNGQGVPQRKNGKATSGKEQPRASDS